MNKQIKLTLEIFPLLGDLSQLHLFSDASGQLLEFPSSLDMENPSLQEFWQLAPP